MDIKFKRKKGTYFKNKNLNPLLEVYCNMVTNISAPCIHQVTDLSPRTRLWNERTGDLSCLWVTGWQQKNWQQLEKNSSIWNPHFWFNTHFKQLINYLYGSKKEAAQSLEYRQQSSEQPWLSWCIGNAVVTIWLHLRDQSSVRRSYWQITMSMKNMFFYSIPILDLYKSFETYGSCQYSLITYQVERVENI